MRRTLLSRRGIVEAAVAIAESEGIEAVTMRRLASDLHTSPMSLYRHVADRRELLVGMLDEVADRVRLPPPAGDPRAEVVAVVTAIHDALRDASWAVGLIVHDKLASERILPAIERIYTALQRSGLSPRDVSVAFALLWHYTVGELTVSHDVTDEDENRQMVRRADPDTYPGITAVLHELPPGPPSDHFAENLQRILDGLRLPG